VRAAVALRELIQDGAGVTALSFNIEEASRRLGPAFTVDWLKLGAQTMQQRMPAGTAVIQDGRSATPETLPPVQCQPWCEYQDGHANEGLVEDQFCSSVELQVPLSFEQRTGLEALTVYASQAPGEDARVVLCATYHVALHLTLAETHQLIEHLQLMLGQIESAR
jgi:hypothetical protein